MLSMQMLILKTLLISFECYFLYILCPNIIVLKFIFICHCFTIRCLKKCIFFIRIIKGENVNPAVHQTYKKNENTMIMDHKFRSGPFSYLTTSTQVKPSYWTMRWKKYTTGFSSIY